MTDTDAVASLRSAYEAFIACLANADIEGFYAVIDDDVVILDEDIPYPLSKQGFQDHISFHGPQNWEGFLYKPREYKLAVQGDTGVIAGYSTFRGKPRDAGYRQRHMMFSQGWRKDGQGWRLVSWHQSPLDGHILGVSPG